MPNENGILRLLRVRIRFVSALSLLGLAVAVDAAHAQAVRTEASTGPEAGIAPVMREAAEVEFRRAGSCIEAENAACASEALEAVSGMELNRWEAAQLWRLRGSAELLSRNAAQATAAFESALETSGLPSGSRRRVLLTLAELYVRGGRQEPALDALREAAGLMDSTAAARPSTGAWVPVLRIAPVYPVAAAAAGLEQGYVLVDFTITARGTVENPGVVESSSALFEQAAADAVRKWRYVPRVEDGEPVAVPGVTTVFHFRLDGVFEGATRSPRPPLSAEDAPRAERGPYEVVTEPAFGSPGHLVFRPADTALGAFPDDDSLPVVVWANGGCARISTVYADFLSTVASHGYLVVTTAPIEPATRWFATVDDLRAAVDWTEAEALREGSPLESKIATERVAAMGQSCGGGLAVGLGTDPRIDTTGVFNAGVFLSAIPGTRRDTYAGLHGPVLLLNGHELDNAMAASAASFDAIDHVPVFYGARYDAGHFATFLHPGGGEFANVASSWLGYTLKRDEQAAETFVGEDCGLCTNASWETRSKALID